MQAAPAMRCTLRPRRSYRGNWSHAKIGRDVRCCHPDGDDARHHRPCDGASAQPHGVGLGLRWTNVACRISRRMSGHASLPSSGSLRCPRNSHTSSSARGAPTWVLGLRRWLVQRRHIGPAIRALERTGRCCFAVRINPMPQAAIIPPSWKPIFRASQIVRCNKSQTSPAKAQGI